MQTVAWWPREMNLLLFVALWAAIFCALSRPTRHRAVTVLAAFALAVPVWWIALIALGVVVGFVFGANAVP